MTPFTPGVTPSSTPPTAFTPTSVTHDAVAPVTFTPAGVTPDAVAPVTFTPSGVTASSTAPVAAFENGMHVESTAALEAIITATTSTQQGLVAAAGVYVRLKISIGYVLMVLTAGTTSGGTGIVIPTDYNASTNAQYWLQVNYPN